MSLRSETALVTGASTGIGRELARVFAESDFDLVLVARSEDKLRDLASELENDYEIRAKALPMDLCDANAPADLFKALADEGIEIDVLVNNAGVAHKGLFHETPLESNMSTLQLNIVALTALTRLFMEPMIERGHGRILNVASIVSFFPTPSVACYGASKAYVLSFTEALSQELKDTGVTITALCPGFTETDMIREALGDSEDNLWQRFFPSFAKMSPYEVAQEGYKACMKGKTVHMDRFTNEVTAQWAKFQPRWVVRRIGGLVSRLTGDAKPE